MTTIPAISEVIEKKINKTLVRLQQGDLTALQVDAFVFYAREDLEIGSGFGTAIQSRGGAAVKQELDKISGVRMGEAVITTAGAMNASYIIHACGPKFQEPETEAKLRNCMQAALRLADLKRLRTLAFPAMGAGFYGVPLDLCCRVMLDAIRNFLQDETSLDEVIICVVDKREFDAFKGKVKAL
jgi:O-acetyl-ADP-ribose deacetylase (regulator of RNase III)